MTLAVLHLNVLMAEALVQRLDREALHQDLSLAINETLNILGVPGRCEIDIIPRPDPEHANKFFFRLELDDTLLPASYRSLAETFHYVAQRPLDYDVRPLDILELLLDLPEEKMRQFVVLAARADLQLSPGLLLTPEALAMYRHSLEAHLASEELPDNAWLGAALRRVLDLRISIADRVAIGEEISANGASEITPNLVVEKLIARLRPDKVEIRLPRASLRRLTLEATEVDQGAFALLRDGLFYEIGLRFPDLEWVPDDTLAENSFAFRINHLTTVPAGGLSANQLLVNDTPDRLSLLDIPGVSSQNPASRYPNSIISVEHRDTAEGAGLTTWTPIGYLVLALNERLMRYAGCLFDLDELQATLSDLKDAFPKLVEAARSQVSGEQMTRALRLLLSEGISIRDLKNILQMLIDFDYILVDESKKIVFDLRLAIHDVPGKAWLEDATNVAMFIRTQLKRHISHKYTRGQNTLMVYLVEPAIEEMLANKDMLDFDEQLSRLPAEAKDSILEAVRDVVGLNAPAQTPPVVLTTSGVRPVFRALIANEFPNLAVLSYGELSSDLNIQPLARISLE